MKDITLNDAVADAVADADVDADVDVDADAGADAEPESAEQKLLKEFQELLAWHRGEFKQERTFVRMCVLALGMIFAFARHTVAQGVMSVGGGARDWTAWYRLFRGQRFGEEDLAHRLAEQTWRHVPEDQPYVTGVDTVQIPRSSLKMPGSGWCLAPRTAVFRRGLHRAQRFLTCAWLPPMVEGFTRAIPIRFLAAFTAKAVPSSVAACKDWEAALHFAEWIRQSLDAAGRRAQTVVLLADGAFDKVDLWRTLPQRVVLITRTAKNRALRAMPGPYGGRGRRPVYGPAVPTPHEHLHDRSDWHSLPIQVRGRVLSMRWKIRGCFLRQGAPHCPVFLLVVGGIDRLIGPRQSKHCRRHPAFYLIRAVQRDGIWQLPFPPALLLALVWQRWELEVVHRDMKAGFGVGQMQCWNPHAAVLSVQWLVWLYGVMVLAGYRAWGWNDVAPLTCAWWRRAPRWSFNTLWRHYRAALWRLPEFRAVCGGSLSSPPNISPSRFTLILSILTAARA